MQNSMCCYSMDWFLYYSTTLFQLHELHFIKREGDRERWIGKNRKKKNVLAYVRILSWKASSYPVFGSKIETDVSWIRMPLNRVTLIFYFFWYFCGSVGVVGIAIGYGLDGPGIESQWGRDFPHLYRPTLGPTRPSVQCVPGLFGGKKRSGRDADPSPPSSAVVTKE
jgi:hypothetical protein